MNSYSRFIFDTYVFDATAGKILLHYNLDDDVSFTETITLPEMDFNIQSSEALDRALFALHLIGGISYYKTCLPKTIDVRSGSLTKDEAMFWNDVYENGLGEFFFKNDIDFHGLINFPSDAAPKPEGNMVRQAHHDKLKVLVPIGGGKDSIVTTELLKAAGKNVTLLRIGGHPLIDSTATIAGLPTITVKRALAPALFKLNEAGALNGHVPITAYVSILSVIVAILHGDDAVVMSNERSANFGNVEFKGKEINHQWSKSLEFERALQKYLEESIGTNVAYVSLLRPWSELKIIEQFTKYPQYFSTFTSCNKNWKIQQPATSNQQPQYLWCGKCPKCAFTFLLLSAFLPKATVLTIFGKNLFDDEALLPLYRELLGLEGYKPFECVGTPEESQAAFFLAHEKGEWESTKAMTMFLAGSASSMQDPKQLIADAMSSSKDHAIPSEFSKILPSS